MMGTPVHRLFFVLPLLLDFVSASHVPNMTRVVSHGPVQLIEGLSLAWTILSSAPTGSDEGWLGLGISPVTGTMAFSQITLCRLLEDGTPTIFETEIYTELVDPKHKPKASPSQNIFDASVFSSVEGTRCEWSRPLASADSSQYSISSGENTLIFARSELPGLQIHFQGDSGTAVYDLFTSEKGIDTISDSLLMSWMKSSHAVTMSITWLLIYPMGVHVARYMKGKSSWLERHVRLQQMGMGSALAFAAVAYLTARNNDSHSWDSHSIMGVVMVVFMAVQFVLGRVLLRVQRSSKIQLGLKAAVVGAHVLVAVGLLVASPFQLSTGIDRFFPSEQNPNNSTSKMVVYLVCIFWVLLWTVLDLRNYYGNGKKQIVPNQRLEPMMWSDVSSQVDRGKRLLVIQGVVYNVEQFFELHPGGRAILEASVGTDATSSFTGEQLDNQESLLPVRSHSSNAFKLLGRMAVGRLPPQEAKREKALQVRLHEPATLVGNNCLGPACSFPVYRLSLDVSKAAHGRWNAAAMEEVGLTLRRRAATAAKAKAKTKTKGKGKGKVGKQRAEAKRRSSLQQLQAAEEKEEEEEKEESNEEQPLQAVERQETSRLFTLQHLRVRSLIKGVVVEKSYTPVPCNAPGRLELLIKVYPKPRGVMSRHLAKKDVGEVVMIKGLLQTNVVGAGQRLVNQQKLFQRLARAVKGEGGASEAGDGSGGVELVALVSCGSGITPVLQLVTFLLQQAARGGEGQGRCRVALLLCDYTAADLAQYKPYLAALEALDARELLFSRTLLRKENMGDFEGTVNETCLARFLLQTREHFGLQAGWPVPPSFLKAADKAGKSKTTIDVKSAKTKNKKNKKVNDDDNEVEMAQFSKKSEQESAHGEAEAAANATAVKVSVFASGSVYFLDEVWSAHEKLGLEPQTMFMIK